MPEFTRPFLYPKQKDAIFCNERWGLTEASTKSGKTVGSIAWILEEAFKAKSGQHCWWVAPVASQAGIAYRRVKAGLTRGSFTTAETPEPRIMLMNGVTIWFKSGDNPDSLYGEDVIAVVVDEASRVKADAWYAVRSTLTATNGKARIIGNVKGRRNWFYALARKAEAGEPGMAYFKILASDAIAAGILASKEIEDAKRDLPEQVFRELYLAEPSDDGGNPFGLLDIGKCVAAITSGPPRVWGWDLAKHVDWTVGVALDMQGKVCGFERFQMPWDDAIGRIVKITGGVPALVAGVSPVFAS